MDYDGSIFIEDRDFQWL